MPEREINFPIGGLSENFSFTKQPPGTTSDAQNVRPLDRDTGRIRGSQRTGLGQYVGARVSGDDEKVYRIVSTSRDQSKVTYTERDEADIDTPVWAKALPSKQRCANIKVDLQGNVYALDGNAAYVKYNPEGDLVYQQAIPVKSSSHVVRALALDDVGGVYVATSGGGSGSAARIFKFQEQLDVNVTERDDDPCQPEQEPKVEEVWSISPTRFVEELIVYQGTLYTLQNDFGRQQAFIVTYTDIFTELPRQVLSRRAAYPGNGLAIRQSDGAVFQCSPPFQDRPRGDPIDSGDEAANIGDEGWTPEDLAQYRERIWAWYDMTQQSHLSDGDKIELITDRSGNARDLLIEDDTATDSEKAEFIAKGMSGRPVASFPAQTKQILASLPNPASGNKNAGRTSIPGDSNAGWVIFGVFTNEDRDNTSRRCLWSQENDSEEGTAGLLINDRSGTQTIDDWSAFFGDSGSAHHATNDVATPGQGSAQESNAVIFGMGLSSGTGVAYDMPDSSIKGQTARRTVIRSNGFFINNISNAFTVNWSTTVSTELFRLGGLGAGQTLTQSATTFTNASALPFEGKLAELIIFRDYVNDGVTGGSNLFQVEDGTPVEGEGSEWSKIEGYLAWKWGLQQQIYSDHPYEENNHGSPLAQDPDKPGVVNLVNGSRTDRESALVRSDEGILAKFAPSTLDIEWVLEGESQPVGSAPSGGIGYGVAVGCDGNIFSVGPETNQSGPGGSEALAAVRRVIDNGETYSIDTADGAWRSYLYSNASTTQTDSFDWQYIRLDVDKFGNLYVPIYETTRDDLAATDVSLYVYQQAANTSGGSSATDNDPILEITLPQSQLGIAVAVDRRVPNYRSAVDLAENVYLATDNRDLTAVVRTGSYTDLTPPRLSETGTFTNYTFTPGDQVTIFRETSGADLSAVTLPFTADVVSRVDNDTIEIAQDLGATSNNDVEFSPVPYVVSARTTLHKLRFVSTTLNTSVTSPREQVVLAVANDAGAPDALDIKKANTTTDAWDAITGGSGVLSASSDYVDATVAFGNVYFTDGVSYVRYKINRTTGAESVETWKARSGGELPKRARLITTWRGRVVLARLEDDPYAWAMSSIGDPLNWDFFPPVATVNQAVLSSLTRTGDMPDIINSIVSYDDDLMFFGGDRSIWRLTGDPNAGGQLDLVTDVVGMSFGRAWTKDPQGILYFVGSRGGVFAMVPGQMPERISYDKVERRLQDIDLSSHYIELLWNYDDEGLHLFVLPYDRDPVGNNAPQQTHYFWEKKTNSWWPDKFARTNDFRYQPTAVSVVDGDAVADRTILIGGADGIVRKWDRTAKSDDINTVVLAWSSTWNTTNFTVGERVDQTTSGASGIVKAVTNANPGDITLESVGGTFATGADTITGASSGGAVTTIDTKTTNKMPIDSNVLIGPFSLAQSGYEVRTSHFTPVLAGDQDGARFEFFLSDEADNKGDAWYAGEMVPGRNDSFSARAKGSYLWIKLSNAAADQAWAVESMLCHFAAMGRKRARARR